MNALLITGMVAASLAGALLLGFRLRPLLPERHLSPDSKDTVKLAMGLVATMTALLLGLLVSAAKDAYDTERNEVIQMAAKVAFAERLLVLYGPDANAAHAALRAVVAEAIRRMWPADAAVAADVAPEAHAGDAVYLAVQTLSPHDDVERGLKTQVTALLLDVAELRTLLLAQSVPSISVPLLVTVVCWLVMIFASFALLAPSNPTTVVSLLAAALSVVGAIFLILELDQPLDGVIRISSAPMVAVTSHMAR